jgi:hypothetical protein
MMQYEKGKIMIIKLDYEELNSIIKCYVKRKLKLKTLGDVNIVCSDSEYGQGVTAEVLAQYENICEYDDKEEEEEEEEKEDGGWFGGLFEVTRKQTGEQEQAGEQVVKEETST